MLDQLDLPLPKDVPVDHNQLPVPKIKELPVITDGYQCNHCSYAIPSKSSMHAHLKDKHADLKVRGKSTHPILLQVIQEHGKNKRCIYVQDKQLDPTPPQAILNANLNTRQLDNAITARAAAFIQQDQAALRDAGLLNPLVDTSMLSGNIGPWAKQLKWRSYWAGKPLAAIGALGTDTSSWPGAHHNFVHWLARMGKASAQRWMQTFMESGRYMQQTFHAYSDAPSEPYNLRPQTIKKRADMWGNVLALLAHLALDGETLHYHGSQGWDQHLVVTDNATEAIHCLRDLSTLFDQGDEDLGTNPDARAAAEHEEGMPKAVSAATSVIASLEFCIRTVLHHHLFNDTDGQLLKMSTSQTEKAMRKHLKENVYHNSNSASAHLQSLHRYGKVLAQDEVTPFICSWAHDLSHVKYGTEEIQITRLQALMHGAQEQAERHLRKLCLLPEDATLAVNLRHVQDDHRNTQPGFNFVTASPELSNLSTVLCRAVAGNVPPAQPLLDAFSKELEFDAEAAQSYFSTHNEFIKLLAVLIELGSGLPARGTELMQLQHTNTLMGPRNIFVHDGSVFTALPTNKGSGRQKIIPRFLPHAVGCMVVYYVSQVAPFVHLLHNAIIKPRSACHMLLSMHTGRPLDTNTVSKMLQALHQQYISSVSSGMTMRMWRQVAVAIDRKLIRPGSASASSKDAEEDNEHDLQAGHLTSTAEQHYGLDASMLYQLTQESMDRMLAVSERWHMFWRMRTRFQEDAQPFSQLVEQGSGADHAQELRGIKRKLELVEESVLTVRRKLEHHTPPSVHSASNSLQLSGASRSAVLPPAVSSALFQITGSHRTKTLEQAYALNAIHAKESPLIIIMATGSGKSALFMAPLHWLPERSVIIVVVPFIALTDDLLQDCCRVGVSAKRWATHQPSRTVAGVGAQLVFVAVENCHSVEFANWARVLQEEKQLAAIFFDECHVCLTQSSFRPAMDKIKALLSSVHVQQYFLTATLPPSLVSILKTTLQLPHDGTGMIRASTNRKNISYAVQQLTSEDSVLLCLEDLLAAHPTGAVMVFCVSKPATTFTATALGCPFITSDMDETYKQTTISTWLRCSTTETDNSKRILAGTTAIGTGINPQHVKLVVHCSNTFDMISYVQESGRAGRNGAPATAVLLAVNNTSVQQYVEEQTCRRLIISTYIDGMPVTCLSLR
ncbi:Helicase, C-terminal, partial [Kalmanozyma brasiliensis GHG001]|uniref:Helicase, C-terminal n=1 Tax=Kalmanozyma brasiliensis (strain GHG001) TaxID=1365824 RepID=UPI002867F0F3